MDDPRAARERDLDRFLTFIDAVVAIAITLLVLPLAELAGEVGDGSVADLLRDHLPEILGFLLSFVVIAQLWMAQHRTVSSLVRQDPLVLRLLLAWALTIVVLPFPTALVAETADQVATKVFYVGTMATSATLLALVAWAMARRPDIRDSAHPPDPAHAVARVLGFLLALAVSVAVPAAGYYPLLVLLLTDPAARLWRRVRPARVAVGE